jgi:hypothetical protein
MKIMDWLIENWFLIVALLSCGVVSFCLVFRFLGMPTEKQKAKVKEWLIWACIEAERALQSGTGQLKLREVWNMFCSVPSFTWVARIITFELFSEWVSDALVEVKQMLISNNNLAEYVYGKDNVENEVSKLREQMEVVRYESK